MQPLQQTPEGARQGPRPATPAAGFAPVTPVGDTPILSLVPPITQADGVHHPDPVAASSAAQQPLPTSPQIPVAPVRRRPRVTPLVTLPGSTPLESVLQVAPLLPGQAVQQPMVNPLPASYGLQPTTFPFPAAPAFQMAPPAWGMMPQPLPMQMFVAYVVLMPTMQPMMPAGMTAQPGWQQGWAGQPAV